MSTVGMAESRRLRRRNPFWMRLRERLVETVLLCCGLLSILVTLAIIYVLSVNSLWFFAYDDGTALSWQGILQRAWEFFTGTVWSAGFQNPQYGIWPLLTATLWIAVIAGTVSIPIGLATAIYLSEYATARVRAIVKPTLEILAGIPSVVYGFFAVITITPLLRGDIFPYMVIVPGLEPFNLLSAGIVVGIMIIPMVASLSEDALQAVPRSLRDGAIALGATKFEVSTRVVVPAGLSGIAASFMLAISRAIGETMAVALASGERFALTFDPRQGVATMTGYIVNVAKGDAVVGSTHYYSLYAVAGLLFVMTLGMNILAQHVTRRYRQVYQ